MDHTVARRRHDGQVLQVVYEDLFLAARGAQHAVARRLVGVPRAARVRRPHESTSTSTPPMCRWRRRARTDCCRMSARSTQPSATTRPVGSPMDKADITVDVVVALVREQFPQWADLPVRPVDVDGNDNTDASGWVTSCSCACRATSATCSASRRSTGGCRVLAPRSCRCRSRSRSRRASRATACSRASWSVYRWLDGETAGAGTPASTEWTFAVDVAAFLDALYRDRRHATDPPPGEHSFWRGAPLSRLRPPDPQGHRRPRRRRSTPTPRPRSGTPPSARRTRTNPVWVHGDVAAEQPRSCETVGSARSSTSAASAVGDPACDTVLAWTFLDGESRDGVPRTACPSTTTPGGAVGAGRSGRRSSRWPGTRVPIRPSSMSAERVLADVIAEHQALG